MSDWSSDVCSSDLLGHVQLAAAAEPCHPLQIGGVAPDLVAVVAPERRRQPPAAAEQLVGIADHQRVGPGLRADLAQPREEPLLPFFRIGLGQQREHRRRRSEEHTSELQSLMRISYAVFCLKKKNT